VNFLVSILDGDGGFVALKRAAEDRGDANFQKGCQKPAVGLQLKTTDDDDGHRGRPSPNS